MKPVVLHTSRQLSKEEKRKRREEEDIYRVGRLELVPPDELSERAKIKFQQIADLAFWLDSLSVDALAAYCQAWDRWLTCVEKMDGTDDVVLQRNVKNEIVAKQNPYRYALRTYLTIMQEMSAKLALYAVDRLRLNQPEEKKKEEEKNPFEEFMSEAI